MKRRPPSRDLQDAGPPVWVAFVALVPAAALAWYRAPRTVAGFAASVAIVFFCFFAFNKMGFTNYYFFVLAALCIAVGAAKPIEKESVG